MSNEVRLLLGAATDVGKVREVNEDAHGFVRSRLGDLLVVCDGMGGHAAGDLASQTALDAILAHAIASRATDERALLEEAIIAAHKEVRRIADASPDRAGMGTTVVAALVRAGWAWVANVGDSRCYLVREGQVTQESKDHTKGQRLLDGGLITPEQLETHPEKGVLVQALGQREVPQPFVSDARQLQLGDTLVLCSDGVYESMHKTMADVAKAKNPNYAAHDLTAKAVEQDGKDNATVIVARYTDLDAPAAPVRAAPVPVAAVPPSGGSGKKPWLWIAVVAGTGLLGFAAGRMTAAKPSAESRVVASPVAVPDEEDKAGGAGADSPADRGPKALDPAPEKDAVSPSDDRNKPAMDHPKPGATPPAAQEGLKQKDDQGADEAKRVRERRRRKGRRRREAQKRLQAKRESERRNTRGTPSPQAVNKAARNARAGTTRPPAAPRKEADK